MVARQGPTTIDQNAWRHWVTGWLSGAGVGVGVGAMRRAAVAGRLPKLRAHQLSAGAHVLGIAQRFHVLQRRYPIPRTQTALAIGATWVALTVGFEVVMGRLISKKPWQEILADYDVRSGHVRPLVVAWMLIGPEVMRRLTPPGDESES